MAVVLVLLALLVICSVALVVQASVQRRRARILQQAGFTRAGAPEGASSPSEAFDRAEGSTAWTRISGGGF